MSQSVQRAQVLLGTHSRRLNGRRAAAASVPNDAAAQTGTYPQNPHNDTVVARRELATIQGQTVNIPQPDRLVHLQFRRFAGCPVCNLHLRCFVRRHDEIVTTGIHEVVIFHSTIADLRHYEGDLPFAVIADPDKRLYEEFGVEGSPRALLDPRAWLPIARAVLHSVEDTIREGRPVPPVMPHGGSLGLPADVLIASDGRVLALANCFDGTLAQVRQSSVETRS